MKVLLVTRGYPQKHNKNLGLFEKDQALALMRAGHDVAYAVVDSRSIRKKRKFGYNKFVDENGLRVFEINWPVGPMPRPLIEYFRSEALLSLYPHILEEFGRPDVVHAHFLNYAVISVKLCKKENLPLVITEHSSFLSAPKYPKRIQNRAIRAYAPSDALIFVSNALRDNVKRQLGYSGCVIPNIVDVKYTTLPERKERTDGTVHFVSAGYLLKGKAFGLLITAFEKVVREEKDIKFYLDIWGDGPEKKNLEDLISRYHLEERVRLRGVYSRNEIGKVYGDADAFVLASEHETFGVVYIEAMAFGLPVIATRCGGPEDFVNEENGRLVECNNAEELAEAIDYMGHNYSAYQPGKIREAALSRFSSETVASQITEVYEKVLSKKEES